MTDCETCRELGRDWFWRVVHRGIAVLALLVLVAIMFGHIRYGGGMPYVAVFSLGVASVFLANFVVVFVRAVSRWRYWRRGDSHRGDFYD